MQRKLTVVEGMAVAQDIARNWEEIKNFQARGDDILIDTYPKSGTTWMQEIVDLVMHDGDEEMCRRASIHERIPFIELFHLVKPGDLCGSQPRDTATSFYHFDHILQFHPDPNPWENYLERFMKGDVGWGSWYEHVKGFWEQREKLNMLYLFFEDVKKSPLQEVRKVAQFLGKNLSDETLDNIVRLSSFEYMRNNPKANYSEFPKEILDQSQTGFMRKGKVGDWKTLFTVQQNELFEKDYQRQMGSSSLTFQDPK